MTDTMCLVFIAYRIDGCAPVMIGANREESRRRPMTSPVCCRGSGRSAACWPAPTTDRTGRSRGWEPGWASTRRAWPSRSPTARRRARPGRTKRARRACWPSTCSASTSPMPASQLRPRRARPRRLRRLQLPDRRRAMPPSSSRPRAPSGSRSSKLAPGIHAMTNLDLDDRDDPRIQFVAANLEPA